jgi:hypothetical protein
MSEQAARTTDAMTLVTMRRRRRIMGKSPDKKGWVKNAVFITAATYDLRPFPKCRFLIRKCLFYIRNSIFLITSPPAEEIFTPVS